MDWVIYHRLTLDFYSNGNQIQYYYRFLHVFLDLPLSYNFHIFSWTYTIWRKSFFFLSLDRNEKLSQWKLFLFVKIVCFSFILYCFYDYCGKTWNQSRHSDFYMNAKCFYSFSQSFWFFLSFERHDVFIPRLSSKTHLDHDVEVHLSFCLFHFLWNTFSKEVST